MIRLSDKLVMETYGKYAIYCNACNEPHVFHTVKPNTLGLRWCFNFDLDSPSFYPDLKIYHPDGRICHSVVLDGNITYTRNSTHQLAGATVVLPNFPD
jgi:hypothetical protein